MKRLFAMILLACLLLSVLPSEGFALETDKEVIIYVFEDGSYLTESTYEHSARSAGTKSGSKERTYYGNDGTAQWKAVLNGVFTYTGTSATCTSSSMNVTIYNSSCYVVSKSATKSGNTATGNATVGEKVLGITVSRIPVTITLSCDANGNLS